MENRARLTALLATAMVGATGMVGAAVLAPSAPAHAVPGLTTVQLESATDSSTTKTVIATCPAGTTVVGGGGHVVDSPYRILLTGLRPVVTAFGNGYQMTATEDGAGYGGAWRIRAHAICAPAPAGLQYRWTVGASSSQSSRGAAVFCPDGRKVIGAGAVVTGGGQRVGLRQVRPLAGLGGVLVGAHETETGYGGAWSLTAWAICAEPLPGLELVSASTAAAGFQANSAQTQCPSPKRVHGVGGAVTGGLGEVFLRGGFPTRADTAIAQGSVDGTGYGGSWGVLGFAICAT